MLIYDCHGCEACTAASRQECAHTEKARPGDGFMGIDVYAKVRRLGLPVEVLARREQRQNRHAFVFLE